MNCAINLQNSSSDLKWFSRSWSDVNILIYISQKKGKSHLLACSSSGLGITKINLSSASVTQTIFLLNCFLTVCVDYTSTSVNQSVFLTPVSLFYPWVNKLSSSWIHWELSKCKPRAGCDPHSHHLIPVWIKVCNCCEVRYAFHMSGTQSQRIQLLMTFYLLLWHSFWPTHDTFHH